jgi:hypothetical protein
MIHLTLNSGKFVRNPKRTLSPELERVIRPFFDKGGGTFPAPFQDYRIDMTVLPTGVAFQFYKGKEAISFCIGTWSAEDAQEYWAEVEKEYNDFAKPFPKFFWAKSPPKMPRELPWLATLLFPTFFLDVKSDSPDVLFLNTCEYVFFEIARQRAGS